MTISETSTTNPPALIVIFGITGDLAQRKLMPALTNLVTGETLHPDTQIIGVTRQKLTKKEVLKQFTESSTHKNIQSLHKNFHVLSFDLSQLDSYISLKNYLDEIETTKKLSFQRLYYLSIPPSIFDDMVGLMGQAGLHKSLRSSAHKPAILVEKPFGYDLESAKRLIKSANKHFDETQVFRIDHYLAKETVQNILTFRSSNPIFDSIWDNQHVQSITITAFEAIGIEGRTNFYEQTGALRDLLQSHLLQLLSVVAMDLPKKTDSTNVHHAKLQLLQSVLTIEPDEVKQLSSRGQYQSFRQEVQNEDSQTETYAAVRLEIDNHRWQGVPIILRTGKAMAAKLTEVSIIFKHSRSLGNDEVNNLSIRIQPNEAIELDLRVKKPGYTHELQTASMEFTYQKAFEGKAQPDAYERVLVDAIKGDHTLFATGEEVIETWRIVNNVISEWAKNNTDLTIYPNGTDETIATSLLESRLRTGEI
ncbi:MAG: glucose-6-phosphate dehydrogenase [bacterium]|nr:glucose-6-phosphate dehydrogenase [bacterium]